MKRLLFNGLLVGYSAMRDGNRISIRETLISNLPYVSFNQNIFNTRIYNLNDYSSISHNPGNREPNSLLT